MTPAEFRHEIVSIKTLVEAGVERLQDLYGRVEDALGPTTVICERCRNVRKSEGEFPADLLSPTRLRVGSGDAVEYIRTTPLLAAFLDRLVAGRGVVQSYETMIFHAYSTGVRRAGQRGDEEPEDAANTLKVIMCRFRKKLAKLKQEVRIVTRHGQGLILISDVPEIVLELH